MATIEQNAQQIKDINIWINSVITASKLSSELATQTDVTDVSEVSVIQKGLDDAKGVKTHLIRGIKGAYNANTNTPILINGVGIEGDTYITTVAGSNDYGSGNINVFVGDILLYILGKWTVINKTYTPIIQIDAKDFQLWKHPNNIINLEVLEVNDIIKGWSSTTRYMEAVYLGGDQTLFDDLTVYNRFAGTTIVPI